MLYYSKKSAKKIVHAESCPYLQKTHAQDRAEFESLIEAHHNGYRLCMHCNSRCVGYMKKISNIAIWNYGNIVSISAKPDYIQIVTYIGSWRISLDNNGQLTLFHKSSQIDRIDPKSVFESYHYQRKLECSLESCCKYISKHDQYKAKHPQSHSKNANTIPSKPQKGSKKWRKLQKASHNKQRERAIANVYRLLESL